MKELNSTFTIGSEIAEGAYSLSEDGSTLTLEPEKAGMLPVIVLVTGEGSVIFPDGQTANVKIFRSGGKEPNPKSAPATEKPSGIRTGSGAAKAFDPLK